MAIGFESELVKKHKESLKQMTVLRSMVERNQRLINNSVTISNKTNKLFNQTLKNQKNSLTYERKRNKVLDDFFSWYKKKEVMDKKQQKKNLLKIFGIAAGVVTGLVSGFIKNTILFFKSIFKFVGKPLKSIRAIGSKFGEKLSKITKKFKGKRKFTPKTMFKVTRIIYKIKGLANLLFNLKPVQAMINFTSRLKTGTFNIFSSVGRITSKIGNFISNLPGFGFAKKWGDRIFGKILVPLNWVWKMFNGLKLAFGAGNEEGGTLGIVQNITEGIGSGTASVLLNMFVQFPLDIIQFIGNRLLGLNLDLDFSEYFSVEGIRNFITGASDWLWNNVTLPIIESVEWLVQKLKNPFQTAKGIAGKLFGKKPEENVQEKQKSKLEEQENILNDLNKKASEEGSLFTHDVTMENLFKDQHSQEDKFWNKIFANNGILSKLILGEVETDEETGEEKRTGGLLGVLKSSMESISASTGSQTGGFSRLQDVGGSIPKGLGTGAISQNLLEQNLAAQEAGIKYDFGSKRSSTGGIDCSGWIAETNKKLMRAINEAAGEEIFDKKAIGAFNASASYQIKQIAELGGGLYKSNISSLKPGMLEGGMLIGLDTGKKGWDEGRPYGIDHIVQAVQDGGSVKITESRGGKGVDLRNISSWQKSLMRSYPSTKLFVTNPLALSKKPLNEVLSKHDGGYVEYGRKGERLVNVLSNEYVIDPNTTSNLIRATEDNIRTQDSLYQKKMSQSQKRSIENSKKYASNIQSIQSQNSQMISKGIKAKKQNQKNKTSREIPDEIENIFILSNNRIM